MERHTNQLIALLEKRLKRLKALAHEIEAAQEACVALDLEALRYHDEQKEHFCRGIRRMDLEIGGLVQSTGPAGSMRAVLVAGLDSESSTAPATARRLDVLIEESEAVRVEVARRNGVYALFLARSRSTLQVMANVISHCLGVYPKLERAASAAAPFERSA